MLDSTSLKFALAAIYSGLLLFGGWHLHGWKTDAETLAAIKAAENRETSIAAQLETKLASFKAQQRTIQRETIKYIDRPVYRNNCLDADGVRNINAAAGAAAEPATNLPAIAPFDRHEWPRGKSNDDRVGE